MVLIFWLRDEEDHFFFPFMHLSFCLVANLRIQCTSRFLLCVIVFYFMLCPARIISYRKENIVEANSPGEIFQCFFILLHHLPTSGSILGFSSRRRKDKGTKILQLGKMQHLMLEIFLLLLVRHRRHQPRTGLNANTVCTL